MGWADKYIENLQAGRAVTFRPRGKSMEGKISDGQLVTVHPLNETIPEVGDIVLCSVGRSQYLHLITATSSRGTLFQIIKERRQGACPADVFWAAITQWLHLDVLGQGGPRREHAHGR